MPAVDDKLFREAPTMEREAGLRLFVENSLGARAPRRSSSRRSSSYRLAHAPDPAGWHAQAAAGATFDDATARGIAAPTLVLAGRRDIVVDPRNAPLLAELIQDARVELFPDARPPVLLGGAASGFADVSEFLG